MNALPAMNSPRPAKRLLMVAATTLVLGLAGMQGTIWTVERWIAGQSQWIRPPGVGILIICGGGPIPDEAKLRFAECAGGRTARVVIIPAFNPVVDPNSAKQQIGMLKDWGLGCVQILHATSARQSNDPDFVRPLRGATGVWLSGGNQSYLTRLYADTEVERELKALLDRGGVIGGTSAGAAVMSPVMLDSSAGNAFRSRGFGLLPGVIIDQHLLRRNRVQRLLDAVAEHPQLIGIGIDENTALLVEMRGPRAFVLGHSFAVACLPPSDERSGSLQVLKAGDSADVDRLRHGDPAMAICLKEFAEMIGAAR